METASFHWAPLGSLASLLWWHFQWCVAGKHRRTSEISATSRWRRAKMLLAYRWAPIREPVRRVWATEDPGRSCKITEPQDTHNLCSPWHPLKCLISRLQLPFHCKTFSALEINYNLNMPPSSLLVLTPALKKLWCRSLQWSPCFVLSIAVRTSTTNWASSNHKSDQINMCQNLCYSSWNSIDITDDWPQAHICIHHKNVWHWFPTEILLQDSHADWFWICNLQKGHSFQLNGDTTRGLPILLNFTVIMLFYHIPQCYACCISANIFVHCLIK